MNDNLKPDHSTRGHSKRGASGAERWMNCPGSVALLSHLDLPESDDPDYRREGTAMHEAAAYCLENGLDTWEITGQTFNDTVVDTPMAQAVQVYLDDVRPDMATAITSYIEYPISSPVHPDFYGSLDFGAVFPDRIKVKDLKGGEGIIVEPDDNPQLKYYAFGIVDGLERDKGMTFPDETIIELTIVQPRGFSLEGPVRMWPTTVGELKAWVHDTLVPAMLATEMDHSLDAGPWCRFCPAKLVCPLLTSLFGAACKANPTEMIHLNDQSIDRSYQYVEAVKFYIKALSDEVFRRLSTGHEFKTAKLVNKKANRVFKDGAPDLAKARFGPEVYMPIEMKSPAELEKLSPEAKAFVKEFAYMPQTGYTVAPMSDPKPAVKITKASETFSAAVDLATKPE